jgi:Enhancer of polycomb-like
LHQSSAPSNFSGVSSACPANEDRYIEYNMDSEDEKWLEALNGGQERLSEHRFELLMDTLEKANAAATDRILTSQGRLPS